jgi:predicted transposase YbfD/YdcC
MIGLLTIICNGNDYAAMSLFGETHESELKKFLELPYGIPSEDTFGRVFSKLNPKMLSAHFLDWIDELKCVINVSIDGKTIRRSKGKGKKAKHVVTAFASNLQLVLGQLATDEKSNEITAIPELLDMFCQKGMVITIDAMGTQTAIAEKIIEKEADYVLALKGNQGTLHEEVKLHFDNETAIQDKESLSQTGMYAKTVEKDHGRIEVRECYVCPEIDWLCGADKWPGLNGVGVIVSKREEIGKNPTISKDYFIYSDKTTTASDLLRTRRAHWAIENSLHWSLDVTFREDDSRARLENAPENLNILRKQALQLIKQETSVKGSVKSKRLRCAYDLFYALTVIGVN